MRNVDLTKARLVEAARHAFAEDGFERTTVRSIAARAAANPALINRYFGGKEGLFAAAVAVDLRLPDLTNLPKEAVGPRLVAHFLERWDAPEDDVLRTLIRSAATTPEAALRMRAILVDQVGTMVEQLAGPERAADRAALVATQILGLAYVRYVLGGPAASLSPGALKAAVGATLTRYLFEPLP